MVAPNLYGRRSVPGRLSHLAPGVQAAAARHFAFAEHRLDPERPPVLAHALETFRIEDYRLGLDRCAGREQLVVQPKTVARGRDTELPLVLYSIKYDTTYIYIYKE